MVTGADDGGSSGRLRKEMGVIPRGYPKSHHGPGRRRAGHGQTDAVPLQGRRSVRAEPGHLLIAALSDMNDGGFMEAVTNLSEVLAVTGRVLPVSLSNIVLHAQLRDGTVVSGESAIP